MKKTIRFISFIMLLTTSSSLLANHRYYPESFHLIFSKHLNKNKLLRSMIKEVLSQKHIKRDGQRDILTKSCNQDNRMYCYGHSPLEYYQAKVMLFGKLHLEKDGMGFFIKDLYCEKNYHNQDFRRGAGVGPGKIPDHNVLNCEHTWPKHRFNKRISRKIQEADLHHLFPTNSVANSIRGHYIFSNTDTEAISSSCPHSRKGLPNKSGKYSATRFSFEPPDSHKGNVARALFYFSVQYNLGIDPVEEAYLKEWNKEDPVDEFEKWRNNEIWKIQGNRNPFIDYPDLADSIENF